MPKVKTSRAAAKRFKTTGTGKIERNAGVRVIRDEVVIHEGKLASLKRFNDDAKEVNKGFECGMQIENYNDIKEGDIIEAFVMDEVKR